MNIEAISSGVKLIASDVGGIKEYVDDHTTLVKYDCNFIYNLYEAMKNKDSNDSYDERKFNINYYSKDNYSKRVINQIKKIGGEIMKIAILSSGLLPIPASNGGAIETLIDDFILTNEKYHKYNIDVYSIPTKKK